MSFAAPSPRPLPRHIAIIMDGNGRWAQARGLPRIAGHRSGADAVRRTLVAANELGIRYLTLFGFSSENWKRPHGEVDDLMGLLRRDQGATDRVRAPPMAGNARQAARLRPAAVAIHDDGDVPGKLSIVKRHLCCT